MSFALKRTETLVSEASVRPLKRKMSEPCLKVAISEEERDATNKVAEEDNPRELSPDPLAIEPVVDVVEDQGEAIALPEQGNAAFVPPPQNTFPSSSQNAAFVPPPQNTFPSSSQNLFFDSATPQPQPFSPSPSIFLTRSYPPPPDSPIGRDTDLLTVRNIMNRLTALPEPRILSARALRNSGAHRLTRLDPHKEFTAYHLINYFLNRIRTCVSGLSILLHGGHGDEQGFRRTPMTREHFAMVGRRLLENLSYLMNIVHGVELSECPRRR